MIRKPHTLNLAGHVLTLDRPVVMGILNATPDSFYDGGSFLDPAAAVRRAGEMLEEGAQILDVGGMSTRPGSQPVDLEEELTRTLPIIEAVLHAFPSALLSIDTIRTEVATRALDAGVSMLNDISGGQADPGMFRLAADYRVPLIAMHMQGDPSNMQDNPLYEDVVHDILLYFVERIRVADEAGVADLIIDPGFGFGKSVRHNYTLLAKLGVFRILEKPILVGISRKSMVCKPLGVAPAQALNGTTALHMPALQNGADILRVHDVKEAVQTVKLYEEYLRAQSADK